MQNIQQELLDVVKKNMPEAQAQAMAELIEDYKKSKELVDKYEKEIETLKSDVESLRSFNQKAIQEIDSYKAEEEQIKTKLGELEEREKELKDKEMQYELHVCQTELAAYKNADAKIEGFFNKVFSNMTYKTSYIENKNAIQNDYYDAQGNYQKRDSGSYHKSISEDKTIEEF